MVSPVSRANFEAYFESNIPRQLFGVDMLRAEKPAISRDQMARSMRGKLCRSVVPAIAKFFIGGEQIPYLLAEAIQRCESGDKDHFGSITHLADEAEKWLIASGRVPEARIASGVIGHFSAGQVGCGIAGADMLSSLYWAALGAEPYYGDVAAYWTVIMDITTSAAEEARNG